MIPRVYLDSLKEKSYLQIIQAGLEAVEFGKLVGPDSRIFIKPNLTFPEYRPGVMTTREAIEAAICAIKEYTSHIYIGDSDSGGYNRFSMDHVYQATRIQETAERLGAQIINLSKEERKPIQFEIKGRPFKVPMPIILIDEIDLLVTMPVPKVHCNTGVSLTFKNQWGCIPANQDRLRLHPYFKQVILEVNRAIKARVAIVDGQFGLTENGPMLGSPVKLDWVLVSNDIGAAARVCCDLMQIDLARIPHLRFAERQGMIPPADQIVMNQGIQSFIGPKFTLHRKVTDLPGSAAFHSPVLAYLAYFSPLSGFFHKLLYLVRKPFYDYDDYK